MLQRWAEFGWLRRLDSALAKFMREREPDASPVLLLSVAVLAQMEGRGHICLSLATLFNDPLSLLELPEQGQTELNELRQRLPNSLAAWVAEIKASQLVKWFDEYEIASLVAGQQPLVLRGTSAAPLLYLRRYFGYEQHVAKHIFQRTQSVEVVDLDRARVNLDRLFTSSDDRFDWQKTACALALRGCLTVITGGPGTGKTYTAARLLALLFAMNDGQKNAQPLRVALAAPTGKAAARLRQSIDISLQELTGKLGDTLDLASFTQGIGAAKTLHSLLGAQYHTRQFTFNAVNQLDVDVLIVDEASMIHLEMMAALLQALPAHAKLILLGDKDQLASVEAGAVLGDLCRDAAAGNYDADTIRYIKHLTGADLPVEYQAEKVQTNSLAQQTVMLRESRRFEGDIGKLALAVNQGQTNVRLSTDPTDDVCQLFAPKVPDLLELATQEGSKASYAKYAVLVSQPPENIDDHSIWVKEVLKAFDQFRILCAVHEGDWGTINLNQAIQKELLKKGWLKITGEWYAGRPVMITRNDRQQGVFNGDIGIALPGPQGKKALRVYFLDGDNLRSVSANRLTQVETAFAMTVHKSQGSEFLHTVLVLPKGSLKVLTRELVYTGITRARAKFTLLEGETGQLQIAIAQKTERASGLLTSSTS